jgi:hypothetical protein
MRITAGPSESTVKCLLSEAELPIWDITPEKLETFFACEVNGAVSGTLL